LLDTAERFGLDCKTLSVACREAYRWHWAGVAQEAQAELDQLARAVRIDPQLAE
jgi:hypothetical protein